MTEYIGYVKGGDVLMAPTVHFKHRYILKCSLCDEYYSEFEEFFSHYLSHNDVKYSEEEPYPAYGGVNKIEIDDDEKLEVPVKEDVETSMFLEVCI